MPEESLIPSWDGDPSSFEQFVQDCKWYESSLKTTERNLAASRIWRRLSGAAKSVVRHLNPADYDTTTGLQKLLDVLRASPLQQLPVPDSFSRLEKWSSLRRTPNETIPQLLVREEDRFVELQQALNRARSERTKTASTLVGTSTAEEHEPPTSPSRSPGFGTGYTGDKGTVPDFKETATDVTMEKDFFSDELRGYRLLKAARLSNQERQHILTLTGNNTRFVEVRRALRTLFAEENTGGDDGNRRKAVWWVDPEWDWQEEEHGYDEAEDWWTADENAYWAGGADYDQEHYETDETYYDTWGDDWWSEGSPSNLEDFAKDDTSDLGAIPENERYEEAYTLATEAAKTLKEARAAVAKVRAARGYYDASGMKGSPKGFKGGKGKGKKGKTKGPPQCFRCGSTNHSYHNCPDRFSPSSSPSGSPMTGGKSKGKFGKGKGKKGKSKQKAYFAEYFVDIAKYDDIANADYLEESIYVLSLHTDQAPQTQCISRVIIDTGATESVCGANAMARILDTLPFGPTHRVSFQDRPIFRFGNGLTQQATSRVDLDTRALGKLSFYVLDRDAENTPPLLGGKELWDRRAVVAYCGSYFAHRNQSGVWLGNQLYHLRGRHVAIDISELPLPLATMMHNLRNERDDDDDEDDEGHGPEDYHDGHGGGPGGRTRNRHRESRSRSRGPNAHDFVNELTEREPQDPANDVEAVIEECEEEEDESMTDMDVDVRPADPEPTYEATPEQALHAGDREEATGKMKDYIPEDVTNQEVETKETVTSSSAWIPRRDPSHQRLRCRVPWCGGCGCRHMQMKPAGEDDDHADEPSDQSESKGAAAPESRHEPNEDHHENSEHGHENSEEHDGHDKSGSGGMVLMMSAVASGQTGPRPPHDERLQDLARRLSDLRRRINGPISSGSPRHRSSSSRLAMWWSAPSDQRAVEPVGIMDNVQEMRTTPGLQGEEREGRPWRSEDFGTTSRGCDGGPAGAADDVHGGSDELPDLPGKDHGDERTPALGDPRTGELQDGCEGERTSWKTAAPADRDGLPGNYIDAYHDHAWTDDTAAYDTNKISEKRVPNSVFGTNLEPGGQDGSKGEGQAKIGTKHTSAESGVAGHIKGEQPWSGGDKLKSLWNSLRNLQEKMRSGSGPTESHQSLQQPKDLQHDNHHTTCTTPTRDTTKDIMSVKNCFSKEVLPPLARKLAKAATLTAVLMQPVRDVFTNIEDKIDLVEIACAPNSSLTNTFETNGLRCLRVNRLTGFDLDTKAGTEHLQKELKKNTPKFGWVSMPCTRLSSLQNLTERDEEAWAKFLKKRGQDLRRSDEVAQALEPLFVKDDMAWEWPKGAVAGWRSSAIRRLERLAKKYGRTLYRIKIDGCAYGLEWQGMPIKKGWQILTTSRTLWLMVGKRCPQNHEHCECRGRAAQASSYYPRKLCQDICHAMRQQWNSQDKHLDYLTEKHLLEIDENEITKYHETDPMESVMALSRTKLNLEEAPKGKRLEAIKQMMMRVHRASGHSGFSNLQRLLEARGSPKWAIELAGTLKCPDCEEASKPRLMPPASTGEEPQLFEILGVDAFEFEDEKGKKKHFGLLWRDRASGLTKIDMLKTTDLGMRWSPSTEIVIKSMAKWLANHPAPTWVVTDPATYFTSAEFADFLARSGIGLTCVPAEAHYLMGAEEQAIGQAKRVVEKMSKEDGKLDIETLFDLATFAMNSHVGGSGFSAYQWIHGKDYMNGENLPIGLDAKKAFSGLLKAREKAKIEYAKEKAREKFSKLANATGRPPTKFFTGQLVMLWRQRVRPGKVKGSWTGPLRVILIEGSTVWLATGSTLVRAKNNQIRPVSKREELNSSLEGTAIYRLPVSTDRLMRSFQGRHYLDVSGDTPSETQMGLDLSQSEVRVPAAQDGPRADSWIVREESGVKTLVRIHNMPRLALFVPTRIATCPVSMDELTGKRVTIIRPDHGGDEVRYEDTMDVIRSLQDRWTGETHFEMKDPRPLKVRRSVPKTGQKRKPEKEAEELRAEEGDQAGGEDQDLPQGEEAQPAEEEGHADEVEGEAIPKTALNEALLERGVDTVDGIPPQITGASGSNGCAAPGCELPGGHSGPHEGPEGKFLYDNYEGKKLITEEPENDDDDSSSSTSSTSSDELLPDVPQQAGQGPQASVNMVEQEEMIYVCELDVTLEDFAWLAEHSSRKKAHVWLSRKMDEKGKEIRWEALPLERKKDYDMAQAKELAQVAQSQALRNLTKAELKEFQPEKCMNMRWVLTQKGDGTAKARLVVLGYQMPGIGHAETASPTLSKVGRNTVLTVAAALGMKLKAGDVTSAFLQARESLEAENLTVWAPPELAVLFGAKPGDPRALRVLRAFYGLVHAPRAWFSSVTNILRKIGWKPLLGDRCLFILEETINDKKTICGICGVHVDDFLIAGKEESTTYHNAEEQLKAEFRFGKWSLASDGIEFAGCNIFQKDNYEVQIDQKVYTEKWIEEIEIDKTRQKGAPLTKGEMSQVRGALGSASWRATQTAPQFLADTSLLLSEVNRGTVQTMEKVNKLVREMKRTSQQKLIFPCWKDEINGLEDLCVLTWTDASNHNRPDKSSTIGILTGAAPKKMMEGAECQVALLQWKSSKCPRQVLGSNGAEVQGLTVGEDMNFQIRALLLEVCGHDLDKKNLHDKVATIPGALILDSRGIYDAATRNLSALHGLRESRAGYELTLAMINAKKALTKIRWVCGLAQLADSLTKYGDRKAILQFMTQKQFWRLVDDPSFTAGRKIHKRALELKLKEMEDSESYFLNAIAELARKNGWPWITDEDVQIDALS